MGLWIGFCYSHPKWPWFLSFSCSCSSGTTPHQLEFRFIQTGGPGKLTFVSIIWLVGLGKCTISSFSYTGNHSILQYIGFLA